MRLSAWLHRSSVVQRMWLTIYSFGLGPEAQPKSNIKTSKRDSVLICVPCRTASEGIFLDSFRFRRGSSVPAISCTVPPKQRQAKGADRNQRHLAGLRNRGVGQADRERDSLAVRLQSPLVVLEAPDLEVGLEHQRDHPVGRHADEVGLIY